MTRRRYRWNDETQALEEVSPDYDPHDPVSGPVTDLYMDGVRSTDGVDIGSRKKRQAYMKANGLADTSDYTQTWEKAAKQREAIRRGEDSTRREAIARAMQQHTTGRR